ncbi:MAG: fused response regulator/phosphatase [Candidatus Electrothrix sp. AR4]|nr:fused response regulator/phosphatase [Candidatus Electrothrix sp. AR4]
MKILIVDDDRVTRSAFSRFLSGKGLHVLTAENGAEALELMARYQIKIIVTDWLMPIMDGLELVRVIRSSTYDQSSYIYIIMLTGRNEETGIIDGVKAGVDEFLFKPTSAEELYLRIRAAQRILVEVKEADQKHQRELRQDQQAYRKMCTELELAAKMQRSMLPKAGRLGDFCFEWLFHPCSYVAGDVFNYFRINKDHLAFYQIDVCGNGVIAALLSVTLYHQIASINSLGDMHGFLMPPSQIIKQLNDEFQSPDIDQYFTIVYGYIEYATGSICLSQAGHPPVLYMKADGRIEEVDIYGLPAGMFAHAQYADTEFCMEPGDRLFVYSDGVTECKNKNEILFSEQRLMAVLQDNFHLPLKVLLETVENHLMLWRLGKINDDTSLMAIEYQRD